MFHKKIISLLIFSLAVSLSFTRCEDELPPRVYARVKTLEVDQISSEGARFNAKITSEGNGDIFEHGFVWDKDPSPTIEYGEKAILTDAIVSGEFSVKITTTLLEGTTYYVRAYSKSDEYLVYGTSVVFSSLGSLAPIINSFEPSIGTFRDTVTISGKNFSYIENNNKVLFNEVESKIISSNDSVILCAVPDGIEEKSASISLSIASQIAKADDPFIMISPELISIEPLIGTFGDTITITGKNFSEINGNNFVRFNDHSAELISFSKDTLKAIIPTTIDEKSNQIEIISNLQSIKADAMFDMIPPRIDAITPESGFTDQLVKIKGDYFNPQDFGNTIIIGDKYAIVEEATREELTIRIPSGIYINRSFPIGVKVANQVAFSEDFTLTDLWIQKSGVPSNGDHYRYRATAFSIGDFGYIGLGLGHSYENAYQDFYKYDPKDNSWTEISEFGGGGRYDTSSFVIDNLAYVGGGWKSSSVFEDTKDFWKYDPSTDQWSRIADMPVGSSDAVGLSAGGFGYVCLKSIENNFWKYDPSSDKWTQLPDLKPLFSGAQGMANAGFAIGNKIYIYTSGNSTGLHQLYEFDTDSQQWTRKTDMIDYGISHGDGVTLNGKGYIFAPYYIHEYDPLNDTWKVVGDIPGNNTRTKLAIEIGDKAYYGSATTGSYTLSDFWEFNPDYKE